MNLVEGRRRLRLTLVSLSGGLCSVLMIVVLLVYGTPYNPLWWPIMAVILVAAWVGPWLIVPLLDWVLRGYLESGEGD